MRGERGDVLIMTIFWFWMIVIVLAAVMVMGQTFVDRRVAQNAAEAASLSVAAEATQLLNPAPPNPGCFQNLWQKPRKNCGKRVTVYPLHGSPYCIDPYTPQECVGFQNAYLHANLGQLQAVADRYAAAEYGSTAGRVTLWPLQHSGWKMELQVSVTKTLFPSGPRLLHLHSTFRVPAVGNAYINY